MEQVKVFLWIAIAVFVVFIAVKFIIPLIITRALMLFMEWRMKTLRKKMAANQVIIDRNDAIINANKAIVDKAEARLKEIDIILKDIELKEAAAAIISKDIKEVTAALKDIELKQAAAANAANEECDCLDCRREREEKSANNEQL